MEMTLTEIRFSSLSFQKEIKKYKFLKRIHSKSCMSVTFTMTKSNILFKTKNGESSKQNSHFYILTVLHELKYI